MDRTELLELVRSLTPRELRVLTYVHDCKQTSSLYTCCNELRCQPCHVQHLKTAHDISQLHAFEKFASAGNLTWKGKDYKQSPKGNKKPHRAVSKDSGVRLEDLSDEQLDRLAELLMNRGLK